MGGYFFSTRNNSGGKIHEIRDGKKKLSSSAIMRVIPVILRSWKIMGEIRLLSCAPSS